MRYQESSERSGELLRLILPRIARHGGGYYPTGYAVWYEYLAGLNPPLAAALDAALGRGGTLSCEDLEQLYERHLHGRDERLTEELQATLAELIRRLLAAAGGAEVSTSDFAEELARCERELAQIRDAEGLRGLLETLSARTAGARGSIRALNAELEASGHEIARLKGELAQLRSEALSDALTGLGNRRGLERAADALLGTRPRGLAGCTLLMLDIDHFKQINDTYGHLLGDRVIGAVARALQRQLRQRDVVARIGGDEFAVLLPDISPADAERLAERIRSTVESGRIRRGDNEDQVARVTVSVGIAAGVQGGTLAELMEHADRALYAAKRRGRNCTCRTAEPTARASPPGPPVGEEPVASAS